MGPAADKTVASACCGFHAFPQPPISLFLLPPMKPFWGHTQLWMPPLMAALSRLENCLSPVTAVACWEVFRERGWRSLTHHCVSGFITLSLTGVFLPHLGPIFWDFLSIYTTWHILAVKTMWCKRKNTGLRARAWTPFSSCVIGVTSLNHNFLIPKIMMPPSWCCCRN